jgi:hypothetical protein
LLTKDVNHLNCQKEREELVTNLPSNPVEVFNRPEMPRFGLRTLFGTVALICIILAIYVEVGPFLATAILLGTSMFVAHLAAAFIGQRMLDRAACRSRPHFRPGFSEGEAPAQPEFAASAARSEPRLPNSGIVSVRNCARSIEGPPGPV